MLAEKREIGNYSSDSINDKIQSIMSEYKSDYMQEGDIIGKEYLLPVTQQEAKQNVNLFMQLLPQIPQDLQYILTDFQESKECIVGITPERVLNDLITDNGEFAVPYEQFDRLQGYINTPYSNLLLVNVPAIEDGENDNKKSYSLFNLTAAARVIQNYPDFFPVTAKQNLREWLQKNTEEWREAKQPLRYGLLSGFPLNAVLNYENFLDSSMDLETYVRDSLGETEANFVQEYPFSASPVRQATKKYQSLIKKAVKDEQSLLPDAETLLLSMHNTGRFIGFDKKKDTQYINDLHKIFKSSGINQALSSRKRR